MDENYVLEIIILTKEGRCDMNKENLFPYESCETINKSRD